MLKAAGLIAAMAWLGWLFWMMSFPWQVTSDDALNFARAIERFSVLEFRPHFPGYPGFVGGAKLLFWLNGGLDAEQCLIAYSVLGAALIPLFVGRLTYTLVESFRIAVSAALAVLASPLLAGLALSGLSDAPALAFFLAALLCAVKQRALAAGLLISLMLATRPSYLPLALLLMVLPSVHQWNLRQLAMLLLPVMLVGSLCLLFLLAKDGWAYFSEGLRFSQGHFVVWGNTLANDIGQPAAWFDHLGDAFTVPVLLVMTASLILSVMSKNPPMQACGFAALGYLGFILLAQNPDNLRHFAPVYFVWIAIFAAQLSLIARPAIILGVVLIGCVIMLGLQWQRGYPDAPSRQAIDLLQDKENDASFAGVVGTNYSVNLMRDKLPGFAVLDMFYPSSESTLMDRSEAEPVWRLSGTKHPSEHYLLEATFEARFPTERDLFLYQLNSPTGGKTND